MESKDAGYWLERKKHISSFWGKGKFILQLSQIIGDKKLSVLELGCGEGHLVGELRKRNPQAEYTGVDYDRGAIERAQVLYPDIVFFHETIQEFLANAERTYDVIVAPNVFHELFSTSLFSHTIAESKEMLEGVIKKTIGLVSQNGVLAILDGVECENSSEEITIRLLNAETQKSFDTFVSTYSFLERQYKVGVNTHEDITMTKHDFTRFITKLRFIETENWEVERKETYQYFTANEYIEVIQKYGLNIFETECFIANLFNWRKNVEVKSGTYPLEHIIILGLK